MRHFTARQLREAYAHAAAGGQALHTHRIIANRAKAPQVFLAAVARGEDIAHLFDRDAARLRATARRLGVRVLLVEDEGGPGQHIDLCGGPLRRALAECVDPPVAQGQSTPLITARPWFDSTRADSIQVRNRRTYDGPGEYIGRPSVLGNPFSHLPRSAAEIRVASRAEAVGRYRDWLRQELPRRGPVYREVVRLLRLYRQRGELTLVCWCAPEACHGDVLKKVLLAP